MVKRRSLGKRFFMSLLGFAFLAVCQLLCVLSTQSIFMLGLKVFGFLKQKHRSSEARLCEFSSASIVFVISSSVLTPSPPHPRGRSCPANELGHDSQPLYSLGDVSRKIFVSVFAPRVIPGTALSPSILARAFCKHYFV